MSTIRSKVLAAAASLTLLAGAGVAAAGSASASSAGCAFTNGCATLRGTDANGSSVAMDAKRQNKTEILIGYPDNAGDGATSFDGVLHYGKGKKTTSYADTGFTLGPNFASIPCITGTPIAATPAGNPLTAGTKTLTVKSTSGTVAVSPLSGNSLTLSGTGGLTVDEQYASDGTSCEAAYTYSVVAGTPTLVTGPDTAHLNFPTSPGSSQFTFLDSDTGGAFTFTGLPAGVSVSDGTLTADTSTAVPGTYTNVGVTYTAPDGATWTATFTLTIAGIKSVTPGAGVAYYTFVYAPAGDWTSQCVTDINGSGALRLLPCTLGKDIGQDFTIGTSNGLLSGSQATVRNLLAEAASPANSYLTDPSTSDPSVPQSDTADALPPGGRQLYVNGTNANLWSWGT